MYLSHCFSTSCLPLHKPVLGETSAQTSPRSGGFAPSGLLETQRGFFSGYGVTSMCQRGLVPSAEQRGFRSTPRRMAKVAGSQDRLPCYLRHLAEPCPL